MGCEPRGFGWSAAVEVCSARVTRLVTDLKNHEKFSTGQLVPGTGRRGEICQHFDWGSQRCLAPGAGARFASISIRGSQRCLARMALYAWGQSASSLAARGSFLLYFRELWQLMMTSKTCLG